MFDVEQARRRARELLSAAKDGRAEALERLPVVRDTPRLADAQLAVAREAGLASWSALLRRHERFRPVGYGDVTWSKVRRVSVVPFNHDGHVVLIAAGSRFVLPRGKVQRGEDPLVDTVLRVSLETAGFRRQGTHVLAISVDATHAVFWVDGSRYHGDRPHRKDAAWWTGPAPDAAGLLAERGDDALARLVEMADHARVRLSREQHAEDSRRLLDASYLAAATPQGGSGFGGTAAEWREQRSIICDAIERDGTFLDVGCANGHLMECIEQWCADKNLTVTVAGIDHSARLIEEARRRLPEAADRLWVGDALTWVHPERERFDFVHTLLDYVPPDRQVEMIDHLLDQVVAPGGRLIVSQYLRGEHDHWAQAVLTRLGYAVRGITRQPPRRANRPPIAPSAWIDKS